jgi:NAD(P)H-dependent FMN reductase
MKLAIFNGSPRLKKSNSKILIEHFLKGYHKRSNESPSVGYLANLKRLEQNVELFKNSEIVLIIFPLYTDCMPGVVKEFFEKIYESGNYSAKKIGFIVQSGFPETIHSVWVEKYLQKLVKRLNCVYLGTVIKGGVEGVQIMPPFLTKKLYHNFEMLGEHFADYQEFHPKIRTMFSKPYKLSPIRILFFKLFQSFGFVNFYWNQNLKKHNAYNKRFDKPYEIIYIKDSKGCK